MKQSTNGYGKAKKATAEMIRRIKNYICIEPMEEDEENVDCIEIAEELYLTGYP
jgi:hypothetical protein